MAELAKADTCDGEQTAAAAAPPAVSAKKEQ